LNFATYQLDPNPAPPPGTYIASARLGDREVLYTGIDLTGGSPGDALVVTFASSRGEITGVVKTPAGSVLAGAIVTLIPEPPRSERRDFARRAGTDQHGEFAFQGVAPGEYRVYAWTSLEMNAEIDADFVKPYRERSTPVTVTETSTQKLELILGPARR
jgi:Carboxypeptidase regulatory-like domain